MRRGFLKKLGAKIFLTISLIVLVAMSVLVIINFFTFQTMFTRLKEDAKDIVKESVSVVDGDKLEKVIESNSMDSVEYKELQDTMIEFKDGKGVKYFYTMAKGEGNLAYIVVDGALDYSPLGEEYELEEAMIQAFNGEIAYVNEPVEDDYGTFISAYAPVKNSSGEIVGIAGVDKDVASFLYIRSKLMFMTIILAICILAISIIISFVFSRNISISVRKLTENLNYMAQGNLTIPLTINRKDEFKNIADSVNCVRENTVNTLGVLKNTSQKVVEEIENLSAVSEEMAASTEDVAEKTREVAKGTNDQTSEIEKINHIMENLEGNINETVQVLETVNANVNLINSKVKTSNNDLGMLDGAMGDIRVSFNGVSEEIDGLNTYLNQITDVTNLINNIAEQINLLALNAAIEAARAGESGKGFAVVAEEIRKLAEQSKSSSSQIDSLLENVVNKSQLVMATSHTMDKKIEDQISTVNSSVSVFKEVIDYVEQVIPQINILSTTINMINEQKETIIDSVETASLASREVASSSELIAMSADQLNIASQEVANAAQNLKGVSDQMMESMHQFEL